MSGKVFVDTNVLVYLFDGDAPTKQRKARQVLQEEGAENRVVISTQVLLEFYVTVTRKLGKPLAPAEAEAAARGCERLLSEDLQHGQRFGRVQVENPFR